MDLKMNNIFIYEANINFLKTDSCHEKIFGTFL